MLDYVSAMKDFAIFFSYTIASKDAVMSLCELSVFFLNILSMNFAAWESLPAFFMLPARLFCLSLRVNACAQTYNRARTTTQPFLYLWLKSDSLGRRGATWVCVCLWGWGGFSLFVPVFFLVYPSISVYQHPILRGAEFNYYTWHRITGHWNTTKMYLFVKAPGCLIWISNPAAVILHTVAQMAKAWYQ